MKLIELHILQSFPVSCLIADTCTKLSPPAWGWFGVGPDSFTRESTSRRLLTRRTRPG